MGKNVHKLCTAFPNIVLSALSDALFTWCYEDMCKNAYRNSGMYRIKEHVSTPLGDAKQIHFLQRQTILYFINDRLIGVTIYGNTTWDNVF